MKLGIISDTHGRFAPGLEGFLNGCDEVFHAGDVTSFDTLLCLRAFAPIAAVRGNNDHTMDTPLSLVRQIGPLTIAMVHDLVSPLTPSLVIRPIIEARRPDVVIHGHTHIPSAQEVDGCLFVNPGSAGGYGRAGHACTLARLDLDLATRCFTLRFFELIEAQLRPLGTPTTHSLRADREATG